MEENKVVNFEEVEISVNEKLVKKFEKLEDLKAFVEEEKRYFEFIQQIPRSDSNLQAPINSFFKIFDDAITRITQVIPSRATQKTVESTLNHIKTQFESSYKTRLLIYSNSNDSTFLKELHSVSVQVAGYAYVYISKQYGSCSWTSHFAIKGAIEGELYSRGLNDKTKASVERSLEEIRSKTQLHLDEYTAKENILEQKFSETLKKTEDMLNEKKSLFEENLRIKISDFETFYKNSNEKLDNVNKAYKELMTLKAPVEYWGDLRFYSYLRALIALLLAATYTYFAGNFVIKQSDRLGLITNETVSYGKIIFFVLLASAFIWILRIIFRYLVGQLHVANESTEKMVMTKTYLALLEDGKLEVSERELVLKNVFRPSGSGLLGEDHPHPAMEIINKVQKPNG